MNYGLGGRWCVSPCLALPIELTAYSSAVAQPPDLGIGIAIGIPSEIRDSVFELPIAIATPIAIPMPNK
jgi:hypothetical protein